MSRKRPPPTLLQLAVQNLLEDEDLAVGALKDLPGELFPEMFVEAFTRGHTDVLKAMVQSWTFPCLPLKSLMNLLEPGTSQTKLGDVLWENRSLQILQAVLDGIDGLLAQKVCPRRVKLQVLDLRDMHKNFWRVWAGKTFENHCNFWFRSMIAACSSVATKRRKIENGPRVSEKQSLKVVLDLPFYHDLQDPFKSYLLKWVQKKKGFVQLECTELDIDLTSTQNITDVLEMANLDSVQELRVYLTSTHSILAQFASSIGQMKNLQKLTLHNICVLLFSKEQTDQLVTKLTSQFPELHCLQEIYLDSVSSPVLRSLTSPLEKLSISCCKPSSSDWNQLPQCPSTRQLKHLELCSARMTDFSPDPLRALLDNVATTLTTLHLQDFSITDAHLHVILPALSRCSQLKIFSYMNSMSVATLESLLSHTARLSNLLLEMYFIPQGIYVPHQGANQRRDQIRDELMRIVDSLNHPRIVRFCAGHHEIYNTSRFCYPMHSSPCSSCISV
ncbi:PRAME family member 12 [Fukomys damarensis]|uniref:PRAME family member 12 n=1 Tax=Fukomys damarensis TaxID=885580 RepID=A0A091DG70_FUKDA|nr:PRAME family member 12 [Fukomys damarensis]KFO29235.1 PRAME family member 12 [Fukomys damarensis]